MKQKSVTLSILCAIILMMACSTSTLPPGKLPKVAQSGRVVSLPEIKTPAIAPDSMTLPALLDSIGVANGTNEADTIDSKAAEDLVAEDEVPQDTIVPAGAESAIKIKRDTTTMDSIELAIYKHNKAIDDSLARDSINKHRKNGIDAPVEYSADVSTAMWSMPPVRWTPPRSNSRARPSSRWAATSMSRRR